MSDKPTGINAVQLSEIEAALRELTDVRDAAVIERTDLSGNRQLVAYVVPSGPFDPTSLRANLETRLAQRVGQLSYVAVSSLPLSFSGKVDLDALARLAVIDSAVVGECEERLRTLPWIDQVAVAVEEDVDPIPPLHLADLLPGWKSAGSLEVDHAHTATIQAQESREFPESGVLAISRGEPLRKDANAPATLPAALKRAVHESPERGVVYIQADGTEDFQPYPALLEDAERILAGLRKLGLKPEDRVIFQLERNQDFIPAYWACQLGGFIPVPVSIAPAYTDADGAAGKLVNAWSMLEYPVTLADEALAPAIRSLASRLDIGNLEVAAIDELRLCVPDHAWHDGKPEDLCLLLLTSGSTGLPKAVALSHANLLSMSAGTAQMNAFSSADVSLNWLPIDHVGAIVFLHTMCVYLGCQQIHAPKEVVLQDPLNWLDWIDRHRATITWAPNFAFGLTNDRADEIDKRNWDLSSMRFLVNAGEAIVARTARQFLKLLARHGLPATSIRPAFGMSETCSGITWSSSFSLDSVSDEDSFVELGPPIPGASLRIVDENNELVKEGDVGRLQVSGDSVTSGYYRSPEINAEAFTADGWFQTGDLGFLRGGRLTITGREKDVIIVNGVNYHGHEIEAVVEEIPGVVVSFTAACAVRVAGTYTDGLAIFFHASSDEDAFLTDLLKAIRGSVVRKIGLNPDYLIPVATKEVPKTAIGKIQRTQLAQRFKAGEFDTIVRRVDILSGNANTLPAWFYGKVWRRKELGARRGKRGAPPTIVFQDQSGVGIQLCSEMTRLGWPCFCVERGTDFSRIAVDRYRIDPRDPEHYRRLLASIAADGFAIEQIAHLWTCDPSANGVTGAEELEQAQDCGVFSLLFLVQSLAQRKDAAQPVRLNVISSVAQHVLAEDVVAYQHGSLLGLIRTVPQEIPWLDCLHLDLPAGDAKANAALVLEELRGGVRETEVAYRQGERWIPRLRRVEFQNEEARELPFKRGGLYLLSGGLGGIGAEIARYLLRQHEARLLVVGRTPLVPENAQGNAAQRDAFVSERINTLRELEQLPGEIHYEAIDVCDLDEMREAVERARRRWRRDLDGVIHLAGTYHEMPLVEETRDTFGSVLRPKVLGTWTLSQLLEDGPDKVFISFSSVNSSFGGGLVGAYSAANSFLDGFAHHRLHQRAARSYCLEWSMWDELGMSRDYRMKELTQSRGYYIISRKQGLWSLLAALRRDRTHLVIGLDGSNENVRKHTSTELCRSQKLRAYFTPKAGGDHMDKLRRLSMEDRFGARIECEFREESQLPMTDAGVIDRDGLARLRQRRGQGATDRVVPRTEAERRIASIWREVLATPQLGVHDSFFEIGGNSLRATQVALRIQEAFGVQLPLRVVLEESTVAKLAAVVQRQLEQMPVGSKEAVGRIETNDAKSILARIDQLSDEEVDKLLHKTLAEGEKR